MTHKNGDRPTDETLTAVACTATGSAAAVTAWASEPLGHRVENLTTARLDRIKLTLDDGNAVTVVTKTLRPASAAPAFASIPPEHHQQVLRDLHWLDEPDVYRSGLGAALPKRRPRRWRAQHAAGVGDAGSSSDSRRSAHTPASAT